MINIGNQKYGWGPTIGKGRKVFVIIHKPTNEIVKVSASSRETFSKEDYASNSLNIALQGVRKQIRILQRDIIELEEGKKEFIRNYSENEKQEKIKEKEKDLKKSFDILNILERSYVFEVDESKMIGGE